ncbi:uncharacterized protein LOC131650425 [Vicia villosa]|uniref:uncharacterized protein LOC131650425 n=1 Tax=Vicia villosa TaxID=3911 RepID=UPI00273B1B75|nr:uncharacterized protein LOC131650425 [Vicia villosa]
MGSSRGRGRPPKKVTQSTGTKHGDGSTTPVTTSPVTAAIPEEHGTVITESNLDKQVTDSDGKGKSKDEPRVEEQMKTKPIGDQNKLWVDVISGNRQTTNGKQLQFVAPKIKEGIFEVEIEEKDVEAEIRFWENSLIMYVIGTNLSMNAMKNYMSRMWNFVALPDMFYNDEGYFILKFKNGDDRDKVLMKGPYTFQNKPVILLEWRHDFTMAKDMLRSIPIWIKLPGLPLPMWGAQSLGKIGSVVGIPDRPPISSCFYVLINGKTFHPVCLSITGTGHISSQGKVIFGKPECPAEKLRVSYARLLVEVDVTQKLCEEIPIRDHEGRVRKQKVEYEWRPQYCERCQKIGHVCSTDKKPPIKVWQAKTTKVDEVNEVSDSVIGDKGLEKEDSTQEEKEIMDKGTWTEIRRRKEDGKKVTCDNSVETRVKQDKAENIRKKIGGQWNYLDNYNKHANGRVWIMWDNNKLTAIYADNKLERRRNLWKDIEKINSTQQGPWCLMGDYNNVLHTDDRIGGKEVHEGEFCDLANMMTKCGLVDLDKIGDKYTWSNKHVSGTIYSCIDRALANKEWFHQRMQWELHVLEPNISDHAMLCLRNRQQDSKPKRLFKFLNKVTDVPEYREHVERNWNRRGRNDSHVKLWDKLLRLQPIIKKLSKPFRGINMQIERARRELEDVQKSIVQDRGNKDLTKEEKDKTDKLMELLAIEE